MPIKAERTRHQSIEMPHQKIGEIERARLGVGERGKDFGGGEELVAVRPRYALDAFRAQHGVKRPAGAAVAVGDENMLVAITVRADLLQHCARYALGAVVQLRRQIAHVEFRPNRSRAAAPRFHAPERRRQSRVRRERCPWDSLRRPR